MPIYDVSAAAEALDIDPKQLDNIISRNAIPGVERRTRGVSRRLTLDAVVVIGVALELVSALRIPVAQAVRTAIELARQEGFAVPVGRYAKLEVDIQTLRASTSKRLDEAVESVGRRVRGRPAVRRGVAPRSHTL
jgi:hypothetical protein